MHRFRPGHRGRHRAGLRGWLLVRTRAGPLVAHGAPRRPAVQRGDRAVCYLAGARVVFAVVEVASHPEYDPARPRWPWRFALCPLLVVPPAEAPPVEACGVLPRSLGRHSYVRLTAEQLRAAEDAITAAAESRPRPRRAPPPARRRQPG